MTFSEFQDSLQNDQPPAGLSDALRALWYAGKDDWDRSHDVAQDIHTPDGSWIHAYLHRWEGDDWNANYWYRRAGRTMPKTSLKEEWKQITETILSI
ncbi:hypothetical protein [Flavilitoribacter nigricans]|uniref:Uncharacterized protein n=1 Tax=Flavilitoribacter nigricans (strain ATCC 23147 / DSM 23189 / NBRC 102662 / NCIMB 1420 / SS-2) TaxID=1122177 RepID=A0A2D0ND16_FLAN2|nr:hypothetical protein [Flavilitoribacter nigricans]PHN06404.1 hypothetical protein CRP01_12610 [Flavilitoribacter nigricans DSM 23189 = NBRC 102662]